MKTLRYEQTVILRVKVPNSVRETPRALTAYLEKNMRWPNIIDGDWLPIESVERVQE
jgi:hypothetical protein